MGWLIAAAAVYFLVLKPQGGGVGAQPARAPTGVQGAAGVVATPNIFRITLPGVLQYTNAPGAGTSISLDPRFFGAGPPPEPSAFSAATPLLATPSLSANYVPEARIQPAITNLLPPATTTDL